MGWAGWSFVHRPFPPLDEHPILVLVEYHTPNFFDALVVWYYVTPFAVVMLTGFISVTIWRVWLEGRRSDFASFSKLPPWPLDPKQKAPAIVIGEVHHPVEAREVFNPSWLTIPERGLYTGVAIFGAVGSGKTSACMNPFARQLLGWQAGSQQKRAAALVLEVKGDFCHDIRQILVEAGRGQDYIELGMNARSQWNPLSAWWLDSYSLAYTVSSLLNQLFGKGKEPFWQQAYTNLVRWIIELYRVFPDRWVTLQQVYRCAIDPELFAAKIEEAKKLSDDLSTGTVFIKEDVLKPQLVTFCRMGLDRCTGHGGKDQQAVYTRPLKEKLDKLKIPHEIVWEPGPGEDTRERVEAVNRWFVHDWQNLDNKIKSSIVEGVSVFLAMFDMPDVAKVFCPVAPLTSDDPQAIILQAAIKRARADKDAKEAEQPEPEADPEPEAQPEPEAKPDPKPEAAPWELVQPVIETDGDQAAAAASPHIKQTAPITQHLPPIYHLIEQGKVLALNMPAGINPALSRAVGVMLKNAWLQALLMRPAKMKATRRVRYFRPAVFICDEYQAFASVGEDDPSGDEKSFALTRQCRCIPIVATQSISSLRAVLGSSEAWRSLLQTLRTRIFLSLSDDAIRQDCVGVMRPGGEDQGILHHQRDLQALGSLPALRPGRRRRREHGRDQIIPGAARGRVSPARLRLALELSSDLSAL